ncbi:MAG: hypothetical protein KF700_04020 [Hyphomonadaceae bacterium]|nr:hypothetical protein [Hyphomonadaceae bacterium]
MPKKIAFDVRGETPNLDHYRRNWVSGPNMGVAGMWIGAVLTDAKGEYFFGLRGADDFVRGMTHTVMPVCGFRKLQKTLNAPPPHLFPEYAGIDWFEPMQYVDTGDNVQLTYDSGRIERTADGFYWSDASGRWELRGKTYSDVCVVHVPKQEGVEHEFAYRHELLKVEGTVAGIEVAGHLHHDYAYAPDGMIYSELPIARVLQGLWVSWLHEYADGRIGGGFFWQGRGDLDFGPGYLLKGGVTTVHNDITANPTLNENGQLVGLDFKIGKEAYGFELEMVGSPIHFFGRISKDSSGELPARSWCWVEYNDGTKLTPQHLDRGVRRVALARGR